MMYQIVIVKCLCVCVFGCYHCLESNILEEAETNLWLNLMSYVGQFRECWMMLSLVIFLLFLLLCVSVSAIMVQPVEHVAIIRRYLKRENFSAGLCQNVLLQSTQNLH